MNSDQLKQIQEPIKEKYRSQPETALVTLKAEGHLSEGIACSVDTGKALVEAGLHPATGGNGSQACSGDMLLQALAGCAGVTFQAVATAFGIKVKDGKVLVEGDLDFRGTLGVTKDSPVGFREIRVRFEVDTDAPAETLEKVIKVTERYCVVLQTLRSAPPILVSGSR